MTTDHNVIEYPKPPLETGFIRLRRWTEDDIAWQVELFEGDTELERWGDSPIPYTEETARESFARSEERRREGEAIFFAIEDASSGELVGGVQLINVNKNRATAGIGYWVATPARNRGVATAAVKVLSAWAFEALSLKRIELWTVPGNASSERVAEKAGFTREGVLRSYAEIRGQRTDAVMYSRLPGDSKA
ncbi:MAG TPA: GNAT family protein [Actinomycetota bacterium]|nr:GNAT family protein [Actinomycetota bacterium]